MNGNFTCSRFTEQSPKTISPATCPALLPSSSVARCSSIRCLFTMLLNNEPVLCRHRLATKRKGARNFMRGPTCRRSFLGRLLRTHQTNPYFGGDLSFRLSLRLAPHPGYMYDLHETAIPCSDDLLFLVFPCSLPCIPIQK